MRSFLTSFVLACLLAGPALAQEGQPGVQPRPDDKDDKEKIRFSPPKKGDKGDEKKPDEKKPEKPAPRDEGLATLLKAIDSWPSGNAMRAIDALVEDAEKSRPALLEKLKAKNRAGRCAAAVALGRIGRAEDAPAILGVARDRKQSRNVNALLAAAEGCDADAARRAGIQILTSAPRLAQARAVKYLGERLRDEDRPALEKVLSSRNVGARVLGLELIRKRFGTETVRPLAFAALGDVSPEVALGAARILSGDEAAAATLAERARTYDSRPAAYAALALALRALAEGTQPFDAATVEALLGGRGLRSLDSLSRGVAAIVLAFVGYERREPAIDAVLESEILPALLDNVGGSRYFRDQPSLKGPSVRLLERLTGKAHGLDVRAWRTWWAAERASFVVRRRLREVRPEDLRDLTIDLAVPGRPVLRVSTDPAGLADGAIVVEPEVARGLVEILKREGFFGDGWTAEPVPGDLYAAVRVGRREHEGARATSEIPEALDEIGRRVDAIRGRTVWQRFWDRDDYPDPAAFVRARAPWFGPSVPAKERDARLRIVIAEALDDLPRDDRQAAVDLLANLRGPALDDRLAHAIMLLAEAEETLSPFAETAIRFLVAERAKVVRTRLVSFLGGLKGPRAATLLADSLAGLGTEAVDASLVDERPSVRRAAVRALGTIGGKEAVRRLRLLLDDSEQGVRLEALAALGKLKARDALPSIARAATEENPPELRAAALRALGAAGGADMIPTLVDALRSESVAVRVAAIQGLEATGDRQAINPLLFAMERDPYAGVIAVAGRAVVTLGGDEARDGLRRLSAKDGLRPAVRRVAVQALGRLGEPEALAALLEDPLVGEEAALALAELRDPRAVPRLLNALATGKSRRVLSALEGISARTFGVRSTDEVATLFLGWWEVHREGSPTDWLISALRDRGHDVTALTKVDTPEREALASLIRALDDESWAIRYAAARELAVRTGESFGRIEKYTSQADAHRVADLWRRWWDEHHRQK